MTTQTTTRPGDTLAARLASLAEAARITPPATPEQRKRHPLFVWSVNDRHSVPLASGEVFTDDLDAAERACDKAVDRIAAEHGTTITYREPWRGDYYTHWARTYDTAAGWRVSFAASVVAV